MSNVKMFTAPTNDGSAGRMFGDPDTRVSLGTVFRKMLQDNSVTEDQLLEKILDWRDKWLENRGLSETFIHNRIEGVKKAIEKNDMSWRDFCDLMAIMGYDEVTLMV